MVGKGKKSAGGILTAVIAWLISAGILLLIGAVVVSGTTIRQGSLAWMSAWIVFLSTAAAAWFCVRGSREGKRGRTGLLVGMVCAVVLLMLGFMIDSERVTIVGLARIVLSALLGSEAGAAVSAKLGRKASVRRISARRKAS